MCVPVCAEFPRDTSPPGMGSSLLLPSAPCRGPTTACGSPGLPDWGGAPSVWGGVDGQQVYEPRTWRSDQLVGRPLGKQDVTGKPHGSQRAASECFLFARLNPDSVPGLFSSGSDSASFRMISFSVVFCLRLLVSATGTLCLWAVTP